MGATLSNFIRSLRRKLNGEEVIENKVKMRTIVIIMMVVHLVYAQLFIMQSVFLPVIYNLLILSAYIMLLRAVQAERGALIYGFSFAELTAHAVVMTVLAGWDSGFFMCVLCVVPISFYIAFSFMESGKRIILPLAITLVLYVVYVVLYRYMLRREPLLSIGGDGISLLFMTNALIVFFLTGVVSLNFILEMVDSTTALETRNESLDHMANVDPLTGLLNRRGMEQHLQEVMSRAKMKGTLFGVMIGDIDNFKRINDTYSHECGDRALIHVAEIMSSAIRTGDAVCRWGGEEFLILVSGNGETTRMIGERIRHMIEDHSFMYRESEIRFTMTFGVSAYEPGFSMAAIIKQADDKLYEGKTSGKNKVVF